MQPMDDFDLIDKYLRNEMTPEEASAFEKTLAHNEELRKEVEIRYDIMVGIRASEQKHILQELDKIDNQLKLNSSKNKELNSTKQQVKISPSIIQKENNFNVAKLVLWLIPLILFLILLYIFNIF